jgi:hypothetical protein
MDLEQNPWFQDSSGIFLVMKTDAAFSHRHCPHVGKILKNFEKRSGIPFITEVYDPRGEKHLDRLLNKTSPWPSVDFYGLFRPGSRPHQCSFSCRDRKNR